MVLCIRVALLLTPTAFSFCLQPLSYPVICRGTGRKVKLFLCRPEGVRRGIGTTVLILRLGAGWT